MNLRDMSVQPFLCRQILLNGIEPLPFLACAEHLRKLSFESLQPEGPKHLKQGCRDQQALSGYSKWGYILNQMNAHSDIPVAPRKMI